MILERAPAFTHLQAVSNLEDELFVRPDISRMQGLLEAGRLTLERFMMDTVDVFQRDLMCATVLNQTCKYRCLFFFFFLIMTMKVLISFHN